MRRIFFSLLLLAFCWTAWASKAEAADPRVLILPFAVNAPAGASQIASDIPALLRSSLGMQGFKTIPAKTTKNTVPTAVQARKQAQAVKARYAVYGTLNQTGEAFSLDMELVEISASSPRLFHADGKNLLELQPVVHSLSGQLATAMRQGISPVAAASHEPLSKDGIADIKVRGLKLLDQDRVLMRVASQRGEPLDMDKVDEDIQNIWDLGYFSDVSADMEGRTLIFTVVEKPKIEDIRVEGSEEVRIGDITEAMSTQKGTVLNEKLLADDIKKVKDLYHKKGFYLVDITYTVDANKNGTAAALVLHVKEGNKLFIKEVAVEGLKDIDPDDIKSNLALKERGMFSWFTGTGVLKDDLLERDSQVIQAYFLKHGYVDGQVSAPEVIYDDDGIRIIFRVREGLRYKIGDIKFDGDLIDTEKRILEVIVMDDHREADEYFDAEILQNDVKALTNFYGDYGYAFAKVDINPVPRPDDAVVDVTYSIKPGEKQYIRRVLMEGNTRTRDNVILREMRLADGQQFDGAKMRRSVQRLDKTRYFTEVNPKVIPTGTPGEVDLKIGVKENDTGTISLGFGYSTYDKFGVMASIRENNLFGKGYSAGISGYVSSKDKDMQLQFVNPRLFDTYWGFFFNPFIVSEEWSYFDRDSIGFKMGVSHPLGEYTGFSLAYKLEKYDLYNMSENASRIIRAYKGKHWGSTVTASITRDTTNKGQFPTEGTKISVSVEYGDKWMGGDELFFKPIIEAGIFYGLNDHHILHARGKAGGAYKIRDNKTVPVFERFWIGGINSIRGYSYDDISPRDPLTNETIGSDRMAYANFEYIWVIKPDIGLALVPFFDIGTNFDSEQYGWFDKIFSSAGLEIRWRSPMGDLRFAYGFPFNKTTEGKRRSSGRFEFSMGQAF